MQAGRAARQGETGFMWRITWIYSKDNRNLVTVREEAYRCEKGLMSIYISMGFELMTQAGCYATKLTPWLWPCGC